MHWEKGLEHLDNITLKKNQMKQRGEALAKGDCW